MEIRKAYERFLSRHFYKYDKVFVSDLRLTYKPLASGSFSQKLGWAIRIEPPPRLSLQDPKNIEIVRPIYTIRFVAYYSYSGICDRVNTCKKRQISNLAISERVKIWHQRSFPYARVRIVGDKSYRADRPYMLPLGSGNEVCDSKTHGCFFLNNFRFFFSFRSLSCSCSIRVRFSASAKLSTAMARNTLSSISGHCQGKNRCEARIAPAT